MDDTGLAMDQENANPTIGYTLVQGNLWRIDVGLSENGTPKSRGLSSYCGYPTYSWTNPNIIYAGNMIFPSKHQ